MAEIPNSLREEKGPAFNIRLFLQQYLKYWYWFILSVVLALGAAWLQLRYATPVYLVNSALLIRENPSRPGDQILGYQEPDPRGSQIENEVELLKSYNLMARVVDALNLTVRYYKQEKLARDEELYDASPVWIYPDSLNQKAYKNPVFVNVLNKQQYELQDKEGNSKGKYFFNRVNKSEYGTFRVELKDSLYKQDGNPTKVTFHNREQITRHYQGMFKVAASLSSQVLKLYIEEALPSRGKVILNKIMEFYTQSALEHKNLEAKNTLRFIDERLKLMTGELNDVEVGFESYRNAQGITDLYAEAGKYLDAVNTSDTKLNEIELEMQHLNNVQNYLDNSQTGSAPAMSSHPDPMLSELLQKLSDLQGQQEKYSRTLQPGNPILQNIGSQIGKIKAAIQENIAYQRQNLELSRANLQKFNGRFESSRRAVPHKERELISIKRQKGIKEELYLLLLRRKEEAAILLASAVIDSRIVDYASSSGGPLKPNKANSYLVAILMGLLIPAGIITARTRFSNKIRSRNEVENETGLTVFGEIMKKPQPKKEDNAVNVVGAETDKAITEQFKLIRANLPYAIGDKPSTGSEVLLITSSISGEGKSFFSVNLSVALAQIDKQVILLELDLRKPKTTDYLGMSGDQVLGITDYLSGQCSVRDLLRPTDYPNLYLISSGYIPPNATELLSSKRMSHLINELRQQFDYILLDTPPVSFIADTTLLAPFADKVFYLVRHDYTPKNCMQLLSSLSLSQKFRSLNIILNGVPYEKSREVEYGYDYRQAANQ